MSRIGTVGLLGYGNFGKYLAKHLLLSKEVNEVLVYDTADPEIVTPDTMLCQRVEDVLQQEICIFAIPMQDFPSTFENFKKHLNKDTLYLDVFSLKMFVQEIVTDYQMHNSDKLKWVGLHPLFGPQSAPDGFFNQDIVACNYTAPVEDYKKVCDFLAINLEANVIESGAREHDKEMAYSQALTHFIGHSINGMGVGGISMRTKTFDDLMKIASVVGGNTPALFEGMQVLNPYAEEARQHFLHRANNVHQYLKLIHK